MISDPERSCVVCGMTYPDMGGFMACESCHQRVADAINAKTRQAIASLKEK